MSIYFRKREELSPLDLGALLWESEVVRFRPHRRRVPACLHYWAFCVLTSKHSQKQDHGDGFIFPLPGNNLNELPAWRGRGRETGAGFHV